MAKQVTTKKLREYAAMMRSNVLSHFLEALADAVENTAGAGAELIQIDATLREQQDSLDNRAEGK